MFLACGCLASVSKIGDKGSSQVPADICLQFDSDRGRCGFVDRLYMDYRSSPDIVSDEITDIIHADAWVYLPG